MLLPHLARLVVEKTVITGDLVSCWVRAAAGLLPVVRDVMFGYFFSNAAITSFIQMLSTPR